MKKKNIVLIISQLIIWYFFIYLWLYTIKNPVNLWVNSLILVLLVSLSVVGLLLKNKN